MPKTDEIVHTFSPDQVAQIAQIRTLLNTGSPVEGEYSVAHIVSAALSALHEDLKGGWLAHMSEERASRALAGWDDGSEWSDHDDGSSDTDRPRRYYETNKQLGVFVGLMENNPRLVLRGNFKGSPLRYLRNAQDAEDLMDELILDLPGSKYSLVFRPTLNGKAFRWIFGVIPKSHKVMRTIKRTGGSFIMLKRKMDTHTSKKWAKVFGIYKG